jgi:hypothetical protein
MTGGEFAFLWACIIGLIVLPVIIILSPTKETNMSTFNDTKPAKTLYHRAINRAYYHRQSHAAVAHIILYAAACVAAIAAAAIVVQVAVA